MVTKLEHGHWYKESCGKVWMYLRVDLYAKYMVMYKSGAIVGLGYELDLSTLVEVCYVNGEEMIVGERYHVSDAPIRPEHLKCYWLTFRGIIDGKPVFENDGREYARAFYATYPHWKLVEPVTTYTLVKSVDGKEVSRVEVSEEKVKELY